MTDIPNKNLMFIQLFLKINMSAETMFTTVWRSTDK
jgi:hypothetical protein